MSDELWECRVTISDWLMNLRLYGNMEYIKKDPGKNMRDIIDKAIAVDPKKFMYWDQVKISEPNFTIKMLDDTFGEPVSIDCWNIVTGESLSWSRG